MSEKLKVTVWQEYHYEKEDAAVRAVYPNGIHGCIGDFLTDAGYEVTLAAIEDEEFGLPDEVLNNTDVLIWWGHMEHDRVSDDLVNKIINRVINCGMGFIALHSSHLSKPFCKLVGTSGRLMWGEDQKEIVWTLLPSHPIAKGIPEYFVLPVEEMYGEPFLIPQPDATVFTSWFEHGNIFRSGCCFIRGLGRIFYFQPGHETLPTFHNEIVQKIIINAVEWAAPQEKYPKHFTICPHFDRLV